MRYRFGGFTCDRATRQLVFNDEEVHLSPKAFELLDFLLVNRSRAVSKAELQQHLWPETFVEETNLAGLVAAIRRALHDPAATPVFVRTVYGFGYRFVGDLREDEPPTRSPSNRARRCLLFEGRELMLMDGTNVIGRAPDATLQIESAGVSRYHARILVANGTATLQDADSKNGTHLNGKRLAAPVVLTDGDLIRLGRISLTFRVATATGPTATVHADTD